LAQFNNWYRGCPIGDVEYSVPVTLWAWAVALVLRDLSNTSPPISGYLAGFVKTTVRGYPRWANFGASTILLLAFSRTPAMANPGGGLDFP
jgi:hypothetical protein